MLPGGIEVENLAKNEFKRIKKVSIDLNFANVIINVVEISGIDFSGN